MTETSTVRISDDTLKQQQNLKVRAEKERTEKYIESLITEDEEEVRKTCDKLAHKFFIPWLNKQNQANKLHFWKKGGVSLLVKWMKEGKDSQTKIAAGTAIWNYAESSLLHEILWKEGAGHALLDFLKSGVAQLERVAIGALFGLLDYSSSERYHLEFSPDPVLIKKIVETKQDTWSFLLAKTGCLLSLAKHPTSRSDLLTLGGIKSFQEENDDTLIDYMNALGLAHLLADNPVMDAEEREKCLEIIRKQLQKDPNDIRKKESRHGVVWSSTKHLLRLIKSEDRTLRHLGLMSYANLSYGDYNRHLMQEEDVLCSILVTQWINDGADEERKKKYIETILKNFGANVAVPSLFQISYHAIKNSPKLAHHLVELEDIL